MVLISQRTKRSGGGESQFAIDDGTAGYTPGLTLSSPTVREGLNTNSVIYLWPMLAHGSLPIYFISRFKSYTRMNLG